MDRAIAKANKMAEAELYKQLKIIFPAATYVLWKEYGWRKTRILRLFDYAHEVWQECASFGVEKSMLEMLEEETGIEIADINKKSYHEYPYLDSKMWDRNPPTKMQLIYIRNKQIQWIPQMIIASISLALHRKEGYGFERIARFINYIQELREQHFDDYKKYVQLMEDNTEFVLRDLKNYT